MTDDDHEEAVQGPQKGDVSVHHVKHVLIPGVRVDDHRHSQEGVPYIIEVEDPIYGISPVFNAITRRIVDPILIMVAAVHPLRALVPSESSLGTDPLNGHIELPKSAVFWLLMVPANVAVRSIVLMKPQDGKEKEDVDEEGGYVC